MSTISFDFIILKKDKMAAAAAVRLCQFTGFWDFTSKLMLMTSKLRIFNRSKKAEKATALPVMWQ